MNSDKQDEEHSYEHEFPPLKLSKEAKATAHAAKTENARRRVQIHQEIVNGAESDRRKSAKDAESHLQAATTEDVLCYK